MKILATADIHIHDYSAYSEYNDEGVPSRLSAFEYLAKDTLKAAKDSGCRVIVVAGDLIHASTVRPMVKHYARKYLDILSSDPDIYVILTHGQHDHDSKAQINNAIHCGISSIIPDKENLMYFSRPGQVLLDDTTFLVCPWQPEKINFDNLTVYIPDQDKDIGNKFPGKTDIFIGHGMIQGCKDYHGFVFSGGFDSKDLCERFKLSIIGDVHCGQIFEYGKSRALIPGSPIQTTFKDDPNCGLWVVDVPQDGRKTMEFKFIPIYDLRDDGTYHKFIFVSDEEDDPSLPHVHVRLKNDKTQISKSPNQKIKAVSDEEVLNLCISEYNKKKPENPNLGEEALRKAYQEIDITESSISANQRMLRIGIENFLSIKDMYLDMENLSGDILLLGENGSGKTSLAEAMYYLMTGLLTKSLKIAEVKNIYTQGSPKVWGDIQVNEKTYRIERDRSSNTLLRFGVVKSKNSDNPKDWEVGYLDKSNVSDTQSLIYEVLGISANDILTLCYFSTSQLSLFNDLGPSDKHDFLGRIVGREKFEALRLNIEKKKKSLEQGRDKIEGSISTINSLIHDKESKILEIKNLSGEDLEKDKPKRDSINSKAKTLLKIDVSEIQDKDLILKLTDIAKNLKSKYDNDADNKAKEIVEKISSLKSSINITETFIRNCLRKIEEIKKKYVTASTGVCYTCNQKLSSDKVLNNLKIDLKSEVISHQDSEESLKEKMLEMSSLEEDKIEINNKTSKNMTITSLCGDIQEIINDIHTYVTDLSLYINKKDPLGNMKFLEEELKELKGKKEETLRECKSSEDLLKEVIMIHTKILSRSGPVSKRLVESACEIVANEMNKLVGNPDVFQSKVSSEGSIDISVSFRGKDFVKISGMSGGERRLTDILLLISLNNIFSNRYDLTDGLLGIAIFDEVFTFLDDKYMDVVTMALSSSSAKTRFIISHDIRLQSEFKNQIYVTNVGGISNYDIRF